jgi:hypothetical protein
MILLCGMGSAAFAYSVYGAIAVKYASLGGQGGILGEPFSDEADAPYGGRFNRFRNGSIYWHPETGAFATWGEIDRKWDQLGRIAFGYPITDERGAADNRGRFNHFRAVHLVGKPEGSIYWTRQTGAHAIYGAIRAKWLSLGAERAALGYPTGEEVQDGGFRRTTFERGFIRWASGTGAEPIMTGVEGPRSGSFAGPVVNGVRVSAAFQGGPATVYLDPSVFSPPELCARALNQPALNDILRNKLVTRIRAVLPRGLGVHSQTNHQIGNTCTARAELVSHRIGILMKVPSNRLFVRITTPRGVPGAVDPNFVITYDLVLTASIAFPSSPPNLVALGPVSATAVNISRPQSNSVTGSQSVDLIAALLAGPSFSGAMQQDGGVELTGLANVVKAMNDALAQLGASSPTGTRFISYPMNDLAVLEATTRPLPPAPR